MRVPFFLEPDYADNFEESNRKRLERKWGGPKEFAIQKKRHRLKERGEAVGIAKFKLDRTASSTWKSHVLVQHVTRSKGLQAAEALYAELNYLHFIQGRKLNDLEMLADAALRTAAIPIQETLALDFTLLESKIKAALHRCAELNIHSIPTFVINGSRLLSGAASVDEFLQLLELMHHEKDDASAQPPLFADILGISHDLIYDSPKALLEPTTFFQPVVTHSVQQSL